MPSSLTPPPQKWYFWGGIFSIIVGVLLFVILLFKNVMHSPGHVPSFVGGYCAVFSTVLSVFQILEHLSCFADPDAQTKVVRILLMVPTYALISWASILYPNAADSMNLVRDAYEAYVLYNFFALMLCLMGGIDAVYRALMIEERPPLPHLMPLNWCLPPMAITPRFVQACRVCLFQFMVIKPLVSCAIVFLVSKGAMGNRLMDVTMGYFWTSLIYNVSITVAFSALVYFYYGLKDFLIGKNALAKFLSIKAVIFLSYWQGILIAILATWQLLPNFDYWSEGQAAARLQDLLICVEMLFVAFAHKYCFGFEEFAADDGEGMKYLPPSRLSVVQNLKYTLRHDDLWVDFKNIVRDR